MTNEELKYAINLSCIPGIGHIASKKLIAYCSGVEAIFSEKKAALLKIPGIGEKVARQILDYNNLERAEEEMEFMKANGIEAHFYLSNNYPVRLAQCADSPILLFSKGRMDLNASKMIAFVGTRKATVKGKRNCEQIIEELAIHQPTIVSGLAYGIDITAHKAAMNQSLSTIAALASGLDDLYPKTHYNTAQKMMEKGGLVSDYLSGSKIIPANFAERNRIIAGMVEAVVVIESSEKGGSLITADLANGYSRDVFALPGRPDDSQSKGCNRLIKTNKAALIESAKDIEYMLGWERGDSKKEMKQQKLFIEFNAEEQSLVDLLQHGKSYGIDEISIQLNMPISKLMSILLDLEFKGVLLSHPGKRFQLA